MTIRRLLGLTWGLLTSIGAQAAESVELAEALDTSAAVSWETSASLPFTGRPDAGAAGGSAAQVGLAPGEESWLEATVDGPGLFDFWLRDVPGAGNPAMEVEWEIFIDGVKSGILPWATTWPAQWVFGEGTHHIRLVFRHPGESEELFFIGVDDVSWHPLAAGDPTGWSASHPGGTNVFATHDGTLAVLPLDTGDTRWIEKAVTGPGVIEWTSRISYGSYPGSNQSLTLDGSCVLGRYFDTDWLTFRLHVPAGEHTLRWASEPEVYEGEPYARRADSVWEIHGLVFHAGESALMAGMDDDESAWLAIGAFEGRQVSAAEYVDGDAWEMAVGSGLLLCNATGQGWFAAGTAWTGGADEERVIRRWVGPGEAVEWVNADELAFTLDGFSVERVGIVSLGEAIETADGLTAEGWWGLMDTERSWDGIDVGRSQVTVPYETHTASMEVEGPARVRFRWKASGMGSFALKVDHVRVPLPPPVGEWNEMEVEVPGPAMLEWVHAGISGTQLDDPGEAWLDAVEVEAVPARTLDEMVSPGSRLAFSSTSDSEETWRQWRSLGFRDEEGLWREGTRGATGSESLRTTVTGPAIVSFRALCTTLIVPRPAASSRSVWSVIDTWPGDVITDRFLSVHVGDRTLLSISDDESNAWEEHRFYVPAGQHEVSWRLGAVRQYGSTADAVPEWQAWVAEVATTSPRADYDAWAEQRLASSGGQEPEDDADGDGAINFLEYAQGTDPEDRGSKPPAVFGRFVPGRFPGEYLLHIPRLPAHIPAELMVSEDLKTWIPSTRTLRSFPKQPSWLDSILGDYDYDFGDFQVMSFTIPEGGKAGYYRVRLTTP